MPENKKSNFPQARARREIMENPEARSLMAEILENARIAMKNERVKSNHELQERIDQYFRMASQRQMPATIEELSLFCGVTSSTLNDWKNGRYIPFHDGEGSGLTTPDIIKRAIEAMHAVDAALAETGKINPVAYIFRSKNYYSMTDKSEVVITPTSEQTTMSREQIEEIAKNLPDSTPISDDTGHVE